MALQDRYEIVFTGGNESTDEAEMIGVILADSTKDDLLSALKETLAERNRATPAW